MEYYIILKNRRNDCITSKATLPISLKENLKNIYVLLLPAETFLRGEKEKLITCSYYSNVE